MAQLREEIEQFAGRVQELIDDHYAEHFQTLTVPKVEVKFGRKYAKVITVGETQRFVYGFVDAHTGDIYKAAGWRAPAKHIRGSIFADDGGMSSCTPYGIVYLR